MSNFGKRMTAIEKELLPTKKVYPANLHDWTSEELMEVLGLPEDATDEQILEVIEFERTRHEHT